MNRYNPTEIEPKWQQFWDENGTYVANLDSDKTKYFSMSMFNYPSGAGIHIGHAMNYTISDVMARFKRQQGYESYHPVGWDAFGLPAENYAIKTGVSPQQSMAQIIPGYHKQYKAMGWSNDWTKEIATHEPEYYKWTQWIFAQMYKAGLAYQDSRMQWWCDIDKTVLSNEQVIDGKCWRHDGPNDPLVEKKEIKQWFFKITDYAEELLEATDALDWTESVKLAQKNWIGKSQGAEIDFAVEPGEPKPNFVVFHGYTGRADKNFIPKLKAKLEANGYAVQAPQLPNTDSPVESEQVGYALENCHYDENTVVVGHSLGGAVAMKVIEKLDHPVRDLILVAPVVEEAFRPEDYVRPFQETFDFTYDYELIRARTNRRVVLSDTQEKENRMAYLEYLAPKIDAELVTVTANRTHFTADDEPDVLAAVIPSVRVFTTRPDTIFGATFMVVAPEHPIVSRLTTDEQKPAIDDYVAEAAKKSEIERMETKEKTGVFTGSYAINPATKEKIPIWIADYVLYGYGTGAIMAVPAHDERDFEFAKKFDLPIRSVVAPDFGDPLPDAKDVTGPVVIGYDPKTKEFMSLLNTVDKRWLVGGGLEDGESYEDAAKRELKEEAGFDSVERLIQLGDPTYSYYYNSNKKSNRRSFSYMYLAILDKSLQGEQALEGHEDFRVVWSDLDEIIKDLESEGESGNDHWLECLGRIGKAVECYEKGIAYEPDLYHDEGVLFNSGEFNGVPSAEAREKIVAWLESEGIGNEKITYKIRDWSVSRQRYWGAPIPIINCPKDGPVLVPDEQLPVVLPELKDFAPSGDGRSALARADEWLKVQCPKCGGESERETDTLDTYICSSWYFLRYLDPKNEEKIFDSGVADRWMPVDFYNGGDHATAHMIYARFVTRFLHKLGLVDDPEPFKRFLFNGKITASDGSAFSKSKGNGVDPLEIIDSGYGADALRTYLMFAAPLEFGARWDPQGVPGTYRFLNRVWTLVQEFSDADEGEKSEEVLKTVHPAIKKATADIEEQKYNTAIAAMMELTNDLYKLKAKDNYGDRKNWQFALESLVALAAPFAPYLAEELWHQLGHDTSVHRDSWPQWNDAFLVSDTMTIVVQVNGKLRAQLDVAKDMPEEEVKSAAMKAENVTRHLDGKAPKKVIYIKNKLVNIVV